MAITQSPTLSASEAPKRTSTSGFFGVTLSSARSVLVSRPTTFSTVSLVPSWKLTTISSAPSMTWWLVTIRPSLALTTKPEPSEDTFRSEFWRSLRLKKSSKNSSNGEPFGTFGKGTPDGPLAFWLVEMLTTASISFSAIGARLCGPLAAPTEVSAAIEARMASISAAMPLRSGPSNRERGRRGCSRPAAARCGRIADGRELRSVMAGP